MKGRNSSLSDQKIFIPWRIQALDPLLTSTATYAHSYIIHSKCEFYRFEFQLVNQKYITIELELVWVLN